MARRKLEKVYRFKLNDTERRNLRKIVIIGCGGNGSHIVPHVARLVRSLRNDIEMVLIDGDIVEEKNLIRQHFIPTDIGTNKAEVLARRYGNALNVNIGHVPEYLTDASASAMLSNGARTLVITCTDNLKSRHLVATKHTGVWIDLGNEKTSGQVSFSNLGGKNWSNKNVPDLTSFAIPHVFELFPEHLTKLKTEKSIEELSCADEAAQSPQQAGFVNLTCSSLAVNYINALFTGLPIGNHMTYFSIENTFEHRSMTKSLLEEWIATHNRFKNLHLV